VNRWTILSDLPSAQAGLRGYPMSFHGFERRKPTKPDFPLRATIDCRNVIAGGYVENLTLNGLYVRLKNHDLTVSNEHVSLDLFLAASNGPSVFRAEARIVQVDQRGVTLQFRPMALSHHNRLKAIIAFVSPDQDSSLI
jgi:hypothetical protein